MGLLVAVLALALLVRPCAGLLHSTAGVTAPEGNGGAVVGRSRVVQVGRARAVHAATVAEAGGGALVAAWFEGTAENAPDVAVRVARLEPGDRAWAPAGTAVAPLDSSTPPRCGPAAGVRCKGMPSTWNPVLLAAPGTGELVLFYKTGASPGTWAGLLKRSADAGRTWSPPEPLPAPVAGPAKNKPLVLPNGTWLAGASTEGVGKETPTGGRERDWRCWVDASDDGGRTWRRHGPLPFPGNAIQPALLRDGRTGLVWAVARSASEIDRAGRVSPPTRDPRNRKRYVHNGRKYVLRAVAEDAGGLVWRKAGRPTSLPGPNSGLDAVTLSDGRALVAYNDAWDTDEKDAARCFQSRCRLALASSRDNGSTWRKELTFADAGAHGANSEFSYPSLIQASDGLVHIVYTHNRTSIVHVVVDPQRLRH